MRQDNLNNSFVRVVVCWFVTSLSLIKVSELLLKGAELMLFTAAILHLIGKGLDMTGKTQIVINPGNIVSQY